MIPILSYNPFVRPGVDQICTLVTAVPDSAMFILIKAQFSYAKRPSRMQWAMVMLSRQLGLIQHRLENLKKPHTIERAFRLATAHDRGSAT